ncbi:MAG: helix-hairpin-helix domain-containing protein [Promethearchaeota archaeon]
MIRMTDTQQGLMQKKSDLEFYYKMAQEAFQENDVDQALKISKSGLEQAKLQNDGDWVNKFDSFNTNISHLQTLTPSIKKETLTLVKGIGPNIAEKLSRHGVSSILELAHTSPIHLAKIDGIGLTKAQKLIDSAKEHQQKKKLNNFSNVKESTNELTKDLKHGPKEDTTRANSSKWFDDKFKMRYPPEENFAEDETSINNLGNPFNEVESFEYEELKEDDEFVINNDFEVAFEPKEQLIIEKPEMNINIPPNNSLVISPELVRQSKLNEQDKNYKEILTLSQIEGLLLKITKELELSKFYIIKESPELRTIFEGIDLLAIKSVRAKEFLELLFIIPIKISSLKGSFIVSSDNIKYCSLENTSEKNFHLDRLPKSDLKALSQVGHIIYSDIRNWGNLFNYFSKYLKINIMLERTITHKSLYFRSGPLQYKILIEPVLICQNTVGFTEKIIPFAYQKQTNIHIIELSQFSDLLQYLDQKYFLIETHSEQKNAMTLNCEASNKFMKDLKKSSAPFMIYGFLVLLFILIQGYSALPLLINLGYGMISFYFVVVGYIYLKLYKQKIELNREFSTPYYLRKLNLNESNLILINEELNSKFMEQFIFECVGNNAEFNIVNKIEQDNAENFFSQKLCKKRFEDSHLFESEPAPHSSNSTKSKDSALKHKLVDKYSSFLED